MDSERPRDDLKGLFEGGFITTTENGYIKLYRGLMDKGFYRDSEYVHLWVHLLMLAAYQDREFLFNGKLQKLKAGQLVTGRKALSMNTGIEQSKCERILKCFESEHQIEQQNTNRFRIISICNWDKYQVSEQQNEQPVNNGRTTDEQPVNTYKKDKKYKKERKTFSSDSIELRLSELLLEKILLRNPNHKRPNIQTWARDVDLMIRIDKRTPEDIRRIIEWCQADPFWQNNILSTEKLRRQFDQVLMKMSGNGARDKHSGIRACPGSQDGGESQLSPYKKCPHCGEEYQEGETIQVGGKVYCPKCPGARDRAREAAQRSPLHVLTGKIGTIGGAVQ
jgi:hypothetical protein